MADEVTLNKDTAQKLINNTILLDRQQLAQALGQSFGSKRDYYEIFGYEKNLEFNDYLAKYNRHNIAGRIVDAAPDETWREAPDVVEKDTEGTDTEFEKGWRQIEDNNRIYHYAKRADKMSRIGRFGILLIGVKDKTPLEQEMPTLNGPNDIVYFSPFNEGRVDIEKWNTDPFSPRYAMPELYKIDLDGNVMTGEETAKNNWTKVHHTRIIHIAENLEEDDVYSRPALKRVYNLLDDLYKIQGAAELFWQNARGGLQLDKQGDFDPALLEESDLEDKADEYIHGLRRILKTAGVNVNKLANDVADPSSTFKVIIQLISAATGIPARVLLGSERGELASSQDEKNWLSQIQTRQTNFAEPVILRPLIDRLIAYGALPEVQYEAKWPDLFKLDDAEKAEMYLNKAKAANEFVMGAASSVVDVEKVLRDELDLPIVEMSEQPLDEDDEDVQKGFEQIQNYEEG